MSENYPVGTTTKTATIDLECPQCGHCWDTVVIIELGIITEDYYDMCPECGELANE